jgi:hypothetical protein
LDPEITLLATPDLSPPEEFVKGVKMDAKTKVLLNENEKHFEHVSSLIKQGHFLKLTKIQQTDATWKAFISNLPKGTMKWLLNSAIDKS